MIHDLKTWPEYFGAIKNGSKTFELRYNDRDFAVGDYLRLREWVQNDVFSSYDAHDPKEEDGVYTGKDIMVRVTYVLAGGKFGLKENWCVINSNRLLRMNINSLTRMSSLKPTTKPSNR